MDHAPPDVARPPFRPELDEGGEEHRETIVRVAAWFRQGPGTAKYVSADELSPFGMDMHAGRERHGSDESGARLTSVELRRIVRATRNLLPGRSKGEVHEADPRSPVDRLRRQHSRARHGCGADIERADQRPRRRRVR